MLAKILPYNKFSKSAKDLAQALQVKRIISSDYKARKGELTINWGTSVASALLRHILNKPYAVRNAINKAVALDLMASAGIPLPDYTKDSGEAARWLRRGSRVVVRHTLTGYGGDGIEIVESGELPKAPLYTKYFRRDKEFRVHVFNKQVIDFTQKRRKRDYVETDRRGDYVRCRGNGWVYCREGVLLPVCVHVAAVNAVAALGLDFGAVDILWRDRDERPVAVLEVNTSPGLEGTTLKRYSDALRGYIDNFSRQAPI